MRLARMQRGDTRALAVAVARGDARARRARRPHVRARRARARRRCSRAATTGACRRCGSRRRRRRSPGSARRSCPPARSPCSSPREGVACLSRSRDRHRRRSWSSATAPATPTGSRSSGRSPGTCARPRASCRSGSVSSSWPSRSWTRASTSSSRAGAATWSRVPLVLLAAGHLKNDGPAALTRARSRHPGVAFRMGRDLGIEPVVLDIVEERARAALGDTAEDTAVVLVGRGSSDPDATSDLYKFARLLADNRGLGMVEPAFAGVARRASPRRWSAAGGSARRASPSSRSSCSRASSCRASTRRPRSTRRSTPELEVVAGAHIGPDRRLARLVIERYREALTGDVRMNCDLCTYRVRLPGYEDKVGTPISLTPHGDGPARGSRRSRRATRAPIKLPALRPAAPVEPGPTILAMDELRYAYPDGTDALAGIDPATSARASGSRSSARTARARRRSRSRRAARSRTSAAPSRSAGIELSREDAAPRSAAAPGSSSRTPTTSSSCRPSRRTSRSGRPTRAWPATTLRARVDEALQSRAHPRARHPRAALAERR